MKPTPRLLRYIPPLLLAVGGVLLFARCGDKNPSGPPETGNDQVEINAYLNDLPTWAAFAGPRPTCCMSAP